MSITHGFEDWEGHAGGFQTNTTVYSKMKVDALLAHARSLEAMLKKHEWAEYEGTYYCPECLGLRDDGHKTDCQLAKLLEGI